ncbi:MAG: hypothetical protein ACD_58C00183G0004, partial [uncultured bacterium]
QVHQPTDKLDANVTLGLTYSIIYDIIKN